MWVGIRDCRWRVSNVPRHCVLLRDLSPVLPVGVCGWGHHGQVRQERFMSPGRKLSCQLKFGGYWRQEKLNNPVTGMKVNSRSSEH